MLQTELEKLGILHAQRYPEHPAHRNLKLHDPHLEYPHYMDELDFECYKNNIRILKLSEEIKTITIDNKVARISNEILCELTFEVSINSDIEHSASVLQYRWTAKHASLALCILSHTMTEEFEDVTRFYKSPCSNPPVFGSNCIRVPCPNKPWNMWALKEEFLVLEKAQLNLF